MFIYYGIMYNKKILVLDNLLCEEVTYEKGDKIFVCFNCGGNDGVEYAI